MITEPTSSRSMTDFRCDVVSGPPHSRLDGSPRAVLTDEIEFTCSVEHAAELRRQPFGGPGGCLNQWPSRWSTGPFIYLIRDDATREILFMGRLLEP